MKVLYEPVAVKRTKYFSVSFRKRKTSHWHFAEKVKNVAPSRNIL